MTDDKPMVECFLCQGSGTLLVQGFPFRCPKCNGTRKIEANPPFIIAGISCR